MVEHFSIVETGHCSVKRRPGEIFPFNFIQKNSNRLLITIGDSWTWGDDLPGRLDWAFGNLVSQQLDSDWLNLAQCGSGNFWLAKKVQELTQLIPTLDYREIFVVCTLTEIGREFNSDYDKSIDYVSWLKNNSPNNLFSFLNQLVVDEIKSLSDIEGVILRVGTNFINHTGLDAIEKFLLPIPWINLLVESNDTCYVVGSPTLDNFKRSKDLFPDTNEFLNWINQLTETALLRQKILKDSNKFKNGHPLKTGHETWAEYILQSL